MERDQSQTNSSLVLQRGMTSRSWWMQVFRRIEPPLPANFQREAKKSLSKRNVQFVLKLELQQR
jgi:hypothetical protein